MVHRLETDDEYFAIQEIKEKLENARNAIKHASDNLRQLETVEIDAANQIMMHQTNRNALKDKGDILISFNKAQQAILETTQIMQSHQDNTIRWRKEMKANHVLRARSDSSDFVYIQCRCVGCQNCF